MEDAISPIVFADFWRLSLYPQERRPEAALARRPFLVDEQSSIDVRELGQVRDGLTHRRERITLVERGADHGGVALHELKDPDIPSVHATAQLGKCLLLLAQEAPCDQRPREGLGFSQEVTRPSLDLVGLCPRLGQQIAESLHAHRRRDGRASLGLEGVHESTQIDLESGARRHFLCLREIMPPLER